MTGVYTVPDFGPSDLLTSAVEGVRRIKVTNQTVARQAFDDGLRFRAFYDFTLATNEVRVIKFIITKEVNLTFSGQFLDNGGLRYRVFAPGPIEGGTFTLAAESLKLNNRLGTPDVAPGITILSGGTLDLTGFSPIDQNNILTAGASAQRSTVDGAQFSPRGFPVTTAYVVLDTLDTAGNVSAPSGLLKYEWTTVAD
jgi:hypothetical protein